MGFPVILQVVGYQNSGKTTVITRLLERLTQQGIKTGVLKHHGHGDELQLNDTGKDTERHRNAGAVITGISSPRNTIFSMDDTLPLTKGIEMYKVLNIECILIEGYKDIQYPRVVLCHNKDDQSLIGTANDPVVIICEECISVKKDCPFFLWSEKDKWLAFLLEYVTSQVSKERSS